MIMTPVINRLCISLCKIFGHYWLDLLSAFRGCLCVPRLIHPSSSFAVAGSRRISLYNWYPMKQCAAKPAQNHIYRYEFYGTQADRLWSLLGFIVTTIQPSPLGVSGRAVVTALPVEFTAVCEHLEERREETHPQGTVYERDLFRPHEGRMWDVVVVSPPTGPADRFPVL